MQKEREESLADPWWRAAVIAGGSKMITEFYDPEFLEGVVRWRREVVDNPFSEKNLHLDRLITALEHGGPITLTELSVLGRKASYRRHAQAVSEKLRLEDGLAKAVGILEQMSSTNAW